MRQRHIFLSQKEISKLAQKYKTTNTSANIMSSRRYLCGKCPTFDASRAIVGAYFGWRTRMRRGESQPEVTSMSAVWSRTRIAGAPYVSPGGGGRGRIYVACTWEAVWECDIWEMYRKYSVVENVPSWGRRPGHVSSDRPWPEVRSRASRVQWI